MGTRRKTPQYMKTPVLTEISDRKRWLASLLYWSFTSASMACLYVPRLSCFEIYMTILTNTMTRIRPYLGPYALLDVLQDGGREGGRNVRSPTADLEVSSPDILWSGRDLEEGLPYLTKLAYSSSPMTIIYSLYANLLRDFNLLSHIQMSDGLHVSNLAIQQQKVPNC